MLFEGLHLLYQDLLLNVMLREELPPLCEFLFVFAMTLGTHYASFVDYYARQEPSLVQKHADEYAAFF